MEDKEGESVVECQKEYEDCLEVKEHKAKE